MTIDLDTILWLIVLACIAYYWVVAVRVKELAVRAAERYCAEVDVQFLDQTVFLKSLRFGRNARGRMDFKRCYGFEFTASGEDRYPGTVIMFGNRVETVQLAPHRLH